MEKMSEILRNRKRTRFLAGQAIIDAIVKGDIKQEDLPRFLSDLRMHALHEGYLQTYIEEAEKMETMTSY